MNPEVVRVQGGDADSVIAARAVSLLRGGSLLIYPTDTFYALGGMALDQDVVRRIIEAKRRPAAKALPMIAVDVAQVRSLCDVWPESAQILSRHFWPGPLTIVLNGRSGLPPEVVGKQGTIAIRVPAADFARRLCRDAGPLVSTSANLSGACSSVCVEAASRSVGAYAALVIDAGPASSNPSTIVDATKRPPSLIREGKVAWESIRAVLDF